MEPKFVTFDLHSSVNLFTAMEIIHTFIQVLYIYVLNVCKRKLNLGLSNSSKMKGVMNIYLNILAGYNLFLNLYSQLFHCPSDIVSYIHCFKNHARFLWCWIMGWVEEYKTVLSVYHSIIWNQSLTHFMVSSFRSLIGFDETL